MATDGTALGLFPLAAVAAWAALGGALGWAAPGLSGRRWRGAGERIAAVGLRVIIGLAAVFAAGRLALGLQDGSGWRQEVAIAVAAGAALLLWLLAPRLARVPVLSAALTGLAATAPWLGLAVALGSGALALGGRPRDEWTVTPYRPPVATQGSRAAASPRLLLIGLDAASWEIVGPLVERGELPHLARMIEGGTWGTLRSTEPSFSPVVWTTIVTGKSPPLHGVRHSAAERRVQPLWQILGQSGLRTAVVNVPGTYPTRGDAEVMLSGFPLEARANFNALGWIVTDGPPSPYAKAPVHVPVVLDEAPRSGAPASATVELVDLPASSHLLETTPAFGLSALAGKDRVTEWVRRLAGSSFVHVSLAVPRDPDSPVIAGRAGEATFELAPGEWSDWLTAERHGERALFRLHHSAEGDGLTLYATPLFLAPQSTFAEPLSDLEPLLRCPHVPEGSGWLLMYDERLLASLRDHLLQVSDCLAENGLAILDRFAPDIFVHVFTVTDRMQHGFLKFRFPDPYLRLARERGGDYQRFAPTPEQVERFGDAVAEAYRRSDAALGRILERAAPGTWVLIVSDHGAQPGPHGTRPTAGAHSPNGIYVLTRLPTDAPTVVPALGRGPELVLEDVVPIALHLLGLPVAEDLVGSVPAFLREALGPPATVATFEQPGSPATGTNTPDAALREQLRSLGYLE